MADMEIPTRSELLARNMRLLVAGNLRILEEGHYSDMLLVCGKHEYRLHRCLVCPRSEVIQKGIEWELQRSHEAVFTLPETEHSAAAVSCAIAYLYQGDYDDREVISPHILVSPKWKPPVEESFSPDARMLANVTVHALADYLRISDLKAFAKAKFETIIRDSWLPSMKTLPRIVDVLFETPANDDMGLQEPVILHCAMFYGTLSAQQDFIDLMHAKPGFGIAVAQAVGAQLAERIDELQDEKAAIAEKLDDIDNRYQERGLQIDAMTSIGRGVHKRLNRVIARRLCRRGGIGESSKIALREGIEGIVDELTPFLPPEDDLDYNPFVNGW